MSNLFRLIKIRFNGFKITQVIRFPNLGFWGIDPNVRSISGRHALFNQGMGGGKRRSGGVGDDLRSQGIPSTIGIGGQLPGSEGTGCTPWVTNHLARLRSHQGVVVHRHHARPSTSPHHLISPRPLVPVGSTCCQAYTPGLFNSSSPSGLTWLPSEEAHLEASFPLRCFQRLSAPQVATRHCGWRHNRHTSAASTPVLSY